MSRLGRLIPRLLPVAAVAALTAGAASALATTAIPNTAPPAPIPVVDGTAGEWGAGDVFANMILAGGNGGQTKVESTVSLRYDCNHHVMYAFVNAADGVVVETNQPDGNFIKLGVKKQVDANSGNDGTAPDFAYVGQNGNTATGWEASFPLEPGTYTDVNVSTEVNDGTPGQTSAVKGRAMTVQIVCPEVPPALLPLQVTKTAAATFDRTFTWTILKEATPATQTVATDTATFGYKVTVTKSAPIDGNFVVAGNIHVENSNPVDVTGVTVTDEVAVGVPCPLDPNLANNVTVPAKVGLKNGAIDIPYSCTLASKTDGTNTATAATANSSASGTADYAFGAPANVTNDAVDVTDAFNGGLPVLLTGGGAVTASTVFNYTRDVAVPASGCTTYPNTATIAASAGFPAGQGLPQSSSASVQACRTAPPVVVPPVVPPVIVGTPNATLRLVKRGPGKATAGQVITYTITVRNASTSTATNVVLKDVLPSGYTVFTLPAGATMQKGKVVWNVGDLAAGASKAVKIRVKIGSKVTGSRCNNSNASASNAPTVAAKACTKVLKVAGASVVPAVTG